ncbi:hypothetical protein KIPB_004325 [Kipferlia bialata]|uniref:Uncharacterized protein n=1 Tax=Kipferlia bialata TaxID=797122 RepID=A0A9K3CTM2_9EUKA|nr:hypothetical protein KIPB_004325 [Kipferlia bialata]|eukprot:g4325.t1
MRSRYICAVLVTILCLSVESVRGEDFASFTASCGVPETVQPTYEASCYYDKLDLCTQLRSDCHTHLALLTMHRLGVIRLVEWANPSALASVVLDTLRQRMLAPLVDRMADGDGECSDPEAILRLIGRVYSGRLVSDGVLPQSPSLTICDAVNTLMAPSRGIESDLRSVRTVMAGLLMGMDTASASPTQSHMDELGSFMLQHCIYHDNLDAYNAGFIALSESGTGAPLSLSLTAPNGQMYTPPPFPIAATRHFFEHDLGLYRERSMDMRVQRMDMYTQGLGTHAHLALQDAHLASVMGVSMYNARGVAAFQAAGLSLGASLGYSLPDPLRALFRLDTVTPALVDVCLSSMLRSDPGLSKSLVDMATRGPKGTRTSIPPRLSSLLSLLAYSAVGVQGERDGEDMRAVSVGLDGSASATLSLCSPHGSAYPADSAAVSALDRLGLLVQCIRMRWTTSPHSSECDAWCAQILAHPLGQALEMDGYSVGSILYTLLHSGLPPSVFETPIY